jgi:hypothetical protein
MVETSYSQVLVVLTCSPALESQLIDWLLSRDEETGFTSSAAYGHSARHDHLSIAEQVIGRQRRQQVQVVLEHAALNGFLESLHADLGEIDLHYWVVPVLASGRVARAGNSGD